MHDHGLNEASENRLTQLGVFPTYQDSNVEVRCFVVGPIDNNVFVVRDKATGEAALIDAANEHDRLLEVADILGVVRVIETHGHWDHVGAVTEVRDRGLEVSIGLDDVHYLTDDQNAVTNYDLEILDEDVITIGSTQLRAIHTPGHTPGSICFELVGTPILFTGDTLFPGGPGATYFAGGDFETIVGSLDNRIFSKFSKETAIFPGHGLGSFLGNERAWFDRMLSN